MQGKTGVPESPSELALLLSYALSFAVFGFLWLRHHAFFRALKGIDVTLVVLNLTYLALITPTASD